MVDLHLLQRRALRASELGRLRAAARLPIALSPLMLPVWNRRSECPECIYVCFLALVLAVLFRWRGHLYGRASSIGLLCGALVVACGLTVERLFPDWRCESVSPVFGTLLCLAVISSLLLLVTAPMAPSRERTIATLISGLMAGLTSTLTCVQTGIAGLLVALAAALVAVTAQLTRTRLATHGEA